MLQFLQHPNEHQNVTDGREKDGKAQKAAGISTFGMHQKFLYMSGEDLVFEESLREVDDIFCLILNFLAVCEAVWCAGEF